MTDKERQMNTDQFEELGPIKNPHADHGWDGTLFETYGVELNFVRSQPENHVWTLVNGEGGNPVVLSGFHIVNRIGYFVTEKPWTEQCEVEV